MNKRLNQILFSTIVLFLAALLVALVWFNWFHYTSSPICTSDSVLELFFARECYTTKSLLPTSWYYCTELLLMRNQLVMTPLFALFSNYSVIHTAFTIVICVLLLVASFILFSAMKLSKPWCLLGGLLLLIPYSIYAIDIYTSSCYYSLYLVLCFIFFYLLIKLWQKIRTTLCVCILSLLSFLMGGMGVRFFLALFLPLAMAFFIEGVSLLLKKNTISQVIKQLQLAPILIPAFFATLGFILNKAVFEKIYTFSLDMPLVLSSSQTFFNYLKELPKLYLSVFGFYLGGSFLENLLPLIFIILHITLSIYLLFQLPRLSFWERIYWYFSVSGFVLNIFILLIFDTGSFPGRYVLFPATFLLLLIPIALAHLQKQNKQILALAFTAVILICGSYYTVREISSLSNSTYNDDIQMVADTLTEKGYDFGYATFWNAGITEYLSEGKLVMAGIEYFDPENPKETLLPYRWGTSKSNFTDKEASATKKFLLLTIDEFENNPLPAHTNPKPIFKNDSYIVFDFYGTLDLESA